MSFVLRRMAEADAEAIHAIHTQCLTRTLSAHYSPAQIAAWLRGRTPQGYLNAALGGERFWVADVGGEVVGFGSWLCDELLALYVHPDGQGRGVGTRLFEACLADAASQGADIVCLNAAKGAESFYARKGYVAVAPSYMTKYDEVIESLRMVRA